MLRCCREGFVASRPPDWSRPGFFSARTAPVGRTSSGDGDGGAVPAGRAVGEGRGPVVGLRLAGAVGGPYAHRVAAGGGVPAVDPLPPQVRCRPSARRRLLPRRRRRSAPRPRRCRGVCAQATPAIGPAPARRWRERLRGVDAGAILIGASAAQSRSIQYASIGVVRRQLMPVIHLQALRSRRDRGRPSGRGSRARGQGLAVHADGDHRVAAVGARVERRADGHAVDVGGRRSGRRRPRRRPARAGRRAGRRASGRRRRRGRRPRWRRRSG